MQKETRQRTKLTRWNSTE